MNKLEAYKKYGFDVMFVGSDWRGTKKWIELESRFNKIGVDIIYFEYTKNTSSTKIRGLIDNGNVNK